jgi:hypothetical protein
MFTVKLCGTFKEIFLRDKIYFKDLQHQICTLPVLADSFNLTFWWENFDGYYFRASIKITYFFSKTAVSNTTRSLKSKNLKTTTTTENYLWNTFIQSHNKCTVKKRRIFSYFLGKVERKEYWSNPSSENYEECFNWILKIKGLHVN